MKKMLSALMSLSLLAGAAAMPAAAAETYSMGDANTDGVVDTRDAVLACRETTLTIFPDYPANSMLTDEQFVLTNVYQDEAEASIDSRDALLILQYYVYTLVAVNPVSPETFFADYETYIEESYKSENIEDASEQAMEEGRDAVEESYLETPGYDPDMFS